MNTGPSEYDAELKLAVARSSTGAEEELYLCPRGSNHSMKQH
jgi:hypothetical protein